MNISELILQVRDFVWGLPLILTFLIIGIILTFALSFAQFRYFITSWKLLFKAKEKTAGAEISSFQAFINALGANTGNGSIAGIATAIFVGGPGAAFWILVAGILALIFRFAEVFLGISITELVRQPDGSMRPVGGPMVYIKRIPFGNPLSYIYTISILLLALVGGCAMQTNSIIIGILRTWDVSLLNNLTYKVVLSSIILIFIAYVVLGGAQRIIKVSDKIIPFKVGVFIISFLIVLIYHYQSLIPALKLIFSSALMPQSICGAAVGLAVQKCISFTVSRLLNASEAGLGTAAILFGASESKKPMRDSVLSMLSVFISTYVVCFGVALTIVASGVWNNGQTSTALTISAFETVFGSWGGWIVTFCSVSFGIGVLVSYAFITRRIWLFLTKGRWPLFVAVFYCAAAFLGGIAPVDLIWNPLDIINGALFTINMLAILYFLPFIRRSISKYIKKDENFVD